MAPYVQGSWQGWKGNTVVELTDGSTWQQAEYHYEYHYQYRPEVFFLRDGRLLVDGMSRAIQVRRIH